MVVRGVVVSRECVTEQASLIYSGSQAMPNVVVGHAIDGGVPNLYTVRSFISGDVYVSHGQG